ncbi:MAG: TIGR01777 family oxidoreductase [Solirubrobacteraceae bacterium]
MSRRFAITGASGLIGSHLASALRERGDEVVTIGRSSGDVHWDPVSGPLPAQALDGCEAVVHLAGAAVAQRWTASARKAIEESRTLGTANLVEGMRASETRVLVSASAVGYYGDRGEERLLEDSGPGSDWLAGICVAWEREAARAAEFGARVCMLRTGVVLAAAGGALEKMLPPFKLGVGGPVAGGRQYMPWIAMADLVGLYLAALDHDWSGVLNASAPAPVTNAAFSKALGSVLHRPAFAPVPALAIRALYGSMAQIVTASQNAIPQRALELGYEFRHTDVHAALSETLS